MFKALPKPWFVTLQRGRTKNGAEGHREHGRNAGAGSASTGPHQKRCGGSCLVRGNPRVHGAASTEPHLERYGGAGYGLSSGTIPLVASTGPHPRRCGELRAGPLASPWSASFNRTAP